MTIRRPQTLLWRKSGQMRKLALHNQSTEARNCTDADNISETSEKTATVQCYTRNQNSGNYHPVYHQGKKLLHSRYLQFICLF